MALKKVTIRIGLNDQYFVRINDVVIGGFHERFYAEIFKIAVEQNLKK